jgi:hypothetical protein
MHEYAEISYFGRKFAAVASRSKLIHAYSGQLSVKFTAIANDFSDLLYPLSNLL